MEEKLSSGAQLLLPLLSFPLPRNSGTALLCWPYTVTQINELERTLGL